jgi:MbtH protein
MPDDVFVVVHNAEQQYSVWFGDREIPPGWEPDSFRGTRAECLTWIGTVWRDLRPLSLRRALGS